MKCRCCVPLGVLFSMTALSTPAAAQDAVEADLRCLVVGYALSGSEQETHKSAAVPFSLYYLGRVDGRSPAIDLGKRLGDLATSMTSDDLKADAARCGADYQRRASALQAAGKTLQDRARAAQ